MSSFRTSVGNLWIWAAVLGLLVTSPAVGWADGCKFRPDGQSVPEREQQATIEWDNGIETLHVAVRSDPSATGSVWIVPVRGHAKAVTAEPIALFPTVTYYDTVNSRAKRVVRQWFASTALLDSGGICCPFVVGGCGGESPHRGGRPKGIGPKVQEHSRIEKLGMVVTVVSTASRLDLQEYLLAQGIAHAAADLTSLAPYFEQPDFAFVCGWEAKSDRPLEASGMKIVFPSPTLWFPMLPTRIYQHAIQTVVYVYGTVKPAAGCDLPGLKCEYIYGDVESVDVRTAFQSIQLESRRDRFKFLSTRMTRVTVTTNPQSWDRDLDLVPGETLSGGVGIAIIGWANTLEPLWSILIGIGWGMLIPWMCVPKVQRRWWDWTFGGLMGAGLILSIWTSTVVFLVWKYGFLRRRGIAPPPYLVAVVGLAIAHLFTVFGICYVLLEWLE